MTLLHYVFLIQLFWASACRNIAKDYAEKTMPGAQCERLKTYYVLSGEDSAVCTWQHRIFVCEESYSVAVKCEYIRDIPAEVPSVR